MWAISRSILDFEVVDRSRKYVLGIGSGNRPCELMRDKRIRNGVF